jgi:hypothetical protein
MPTVYPEINLVSFFGDSVEFDPRSGRVEQGRGGVIDRKRIHFINATKRTYSLNATLKDRDDLQEFLEDNRGTPFVFRFNGISPGLFITKGWTWTWVVYAEGNGVWKLSLNLEEVFRPGWVPISTGSGTLTFPQIQVTGTGNVSAGTPVGNGTISIPRLTLAGSGTSAGLRTGSGDLQIEAISVSGDGALILSASGNIQIPTVIVTGSGTAGPPVIGSGNLTLPEISLSSNGSLINSGSGDMFVSTVSVAGTGTISSVSDIRETASGDIRITTDGDTRILP